MFYGWPGRVGPGRAGPGRVAQNSIVIRVYLLGIPVVNEVIFFYKNHYKIPLRGNKFIFQRAVWKRKKNILSI